MKGYKVGIIIRGVDGGVMVMDRRLCSTKELAQEDVQIAGELIGSLARANATLPSGREVEVRDILTALGVGTIQCGIAEAEIVDSNLVKPEPPKLVIVKS